VPGDGLVAPLNAPAGGQLTPGVQPGVTPGIVLAQYVIVFGTAGGVFVYSGTPGPGNPPIAWLSSATADPYGNTLTPADNVVIGAGQDGSPQVVLESSSGAGEIAFPLPGNWVNFPNMFGSVLGSGGLLSINGPTDTTVDDQAFIGIASAAAGFSGGSAGFLNYLDANGGDNTIALWGDGGLLVNVAANVFGVKPGTGTSATNPAAQESWHAMTPLLNSWANVAGFASAQYRKVASPVNSVEIIGAINAAAATAAGFFTLPAGYRPAHNVPVCSMGANASVPSGLSPWIECTTAGALSVQNTGALGAWESFFHGFIPLDA
jgi:hypothetical protein